MGHIGPVQGSFDVLPLRAQQTVARGSTQGALADGTEPSPSVPPPQPMPAPYPEPVPEPAPVPAPDPAPDPVPAPGRR